MKKAIRTPSNTKSGTKPNTKPGTKLNPKLGTKPNTKLGTKLNPKLGTKPNTKLGTKPNTKPELKPQTKSDQKPFLKSGTNPKLKAKPAPMTESQVKPDADPKPAPKRRPQKLDHLIVDKQNELLNFLYEQLPQEGRNSIKSLLAHRQVSVDGEMTTLYNYPLAAGQKVTINRGKVSQGRRKHRPLKSYSAKTDKISPMKKVTSEKALNSNVKKAIPLRDKK
ncbi:hypothetical protein LPY66_16995 [Dehalobacter sp. DCM]|uniref:RNA-binding S4 domain-containing protein n=1 Tax=Dehalobacter sp. DCM TaxID=2907827 RepID=UPI0030818BF4|nr:hypothetical protein LPY66_16995 [Dehalobacter sp. DCM]